MNEEAELLRQCEAERYARLVRELGELIARRGVEAVCDEDGWEIVLADIQDAANDALPEPQW